MGTVVRPDLLLLVAGRSHRTLRSHALKIGKQLRDAAVVKPATLASTMTITAHSSVIHRFHDREPRLEVRTGNSQAAGGKRRVFASVARADPEVAVLIRRGLEDVGLTADTALVAFTDGCPALQPILAEAGVRKEPIADGFHVVMRLQHAKQAAGGLSTGEAARIQVKAAIVAEVKRLPRRI